MKTSVILFTAILMVVFSVRSQQFVGTGGEYSVFENHTVSFTVGELASETVYYEDYILTQGFQQPWYTAAEKDSLALVALYYVTNGVAWTNNLNWLTGPVNSWYGIEIKNHRVTEIVLADNNLVGILPSEIKDLTELQILNLSINQINGQIPNELGYLTNLLELKLDNNHLSDTIPSEICENLNNLTFLSLDHNDLSIGSCPEINCLITRGNWNDFAHSPQNNGFIFMDDCPIIFYDSPYFKNIGDIPNDQGKQLQITWYKSIHDENYSPNQFYSLWRLDEEFSENALKIDSPEKANKIQLNPDKKYYWVKDGEVWTYINTIPAIQQEQYAYISPTLVDSCAEGINFSIFKVLFHNETAFYQSAPDSGYSVDNLAPYAPEDLNGFLADHQVELTWEPVPDEDFQYYAIYKSEDQLLFPSEPFAFSTKGEFYDPDLTFDTIYYKVTAFDYNGNESEFSNLMKLKKIFMDLKVLLEGPFTSPDMTTDLNSAGMIPLTQPFNQPPWNYSGDEAVVSIPNMDVVDWLLIELRDATDALSADGTTTITRQAGFLLKDGSVVGIDGSSILQFDNSYSQQLFVVVWHRNHLGIMTATGVMESDGIYTYDFSVSGNQVYGGNSGYKEVGGVWVMVAGDSNHDGLINLSDKDQWENFAGQKGYLDSDFNLDSQVNNHDKNEKWYPNRIYTRQIPE